MHLTDCRITEATISSAPSIGTYMQKQSILGLSKQGKQRTFVSYDVVKLGTVVLRKLVSLFLPESVMSERHSL